MNQTVETVVLDPARAQSLRSIGIVSYILHTIVAVGAVLPGVQASVLLLIVAVIIDLVKRDEAAGTWQASHFSWRLRSVVWAGVLYALTLPLWFLFLIPGWIAWALISIWFLYRIVRGWTTMNANQAMPR
ncbi:hypothetical protein PEC18_14315 [Paucibacter sp. O1-1]|uniref:DUF4870 family protein n=1 Tax=Roseateles TaxID=93681 RepID=UPI0021D48CCA|nr:MULTISPECIES: hypothetical protein [unclassified Roseateles]MCU7371999.1 hypothetical protein [Paucibacter sp. O1-1]MCZ7880802.1 hypothetical protein [Paucibacter sp. M5-1]MDA3826990.1 hypothetical protein [Paucibacter sp. O1-1]MDC6167569.1 hypothetical protein [Paucibacter sp. XJ19-41]